MRIGFSLLNSWGIEDAQALVGLASRAEELGSDSVWVHDHVFNVGHVFDRIGGKIGGISRAVIRRAARLGDGWQPFGLSPEALGHGIETLRQEALACGRDVSKIPVSIALGLGAPTSRRRSALGNDPAEIVRNAKTFAWLGVEALVVSANTSDPSEARSAMAMPAREVLPAFPGERSTR